LGVFLELSCLWRLAQMSRPDPSDVAGESCLDQKGIVMGKQRTGGMTTVGILNIIFGALFSLVFLLMILGAGFMAAAGTAMGGEDGAAVAAGGGFLMILGIAAFAINLMLFISGIGVLKVAPWGRSLSIASAGLGVVVYGTMLVAVDFSIPMFAALAYGVTLIGLCFTSSWKETFCSSEMTTPVSTPAPPEVSEPSEPSGASEASESDETREAA
jgi:hypothetical protein